MAHVNLICHGMMLFVERETDMEILIPAIDEHDYCVGAPSGRACDPFPETLPGGEYYLNGDFTNGAGLDALDPDEHLLIRHDRVDLVRVQHVALRVPKPHRVHLFRRIGPPHTDTIMGSVPADTVIAVPTFVHDVTAFVFDQVPDGSEVSLGTLFRATVAEKTPVNLSIYAQIGPAAMPEDTGQRTPHATGLNDLLRLKQTSAPPDFHLSAIGTAPGHVGPIPDGIERCALLSLFELAHFETDGTGCSPATVVRRP